MPKNILRIISSPRGSRSLSFQLGNAIVQKIQARYPGSRLKERNLNTEIFPHLQETLISSFFTPAENHSPEQSAAIKYSDQAIAELRDADILVIDTPMYNFTITATLKNYFDHIVRRGLTFRVTEQGAEGLLKNKKAYLAFSSSGIYSAGGPDKSNDFVTPLVKAILGWIGVSDIEVYRAEGFRYPGIGEDAALQKGIESISIA